MDKRGSFPEPGQWKNINAVNISTSRLTKYEGSCGSDQTDPARVVELFPVVVTPLGWTAEEPELARVLAMMRSPQSVLHWLAGSLGKKRPMVAGRHPLQDAAEVLRVEAQGSTGLELLPLPAVSLETFEQYGSISVRNI